MVFKLETKQDFHTLASIWHVCAAQTNPTRACFEWTKIKG